MEFYVLAWQLEFGWLAISISTIKIILDIIVNSGIIVTMSEQSKRLTVTIDPELKQQFKAEVSRRGMNLKDTIQMMIQSYLLNNQSS